MYFVFSRILCFLEDAGMTKYGWLLNHHVKEEHHLHVREFSMAIFVY